MIGEVIDLDTVRLRAHDHIVRGTACHGLVRAVAVDARETVQEARTRHCSSPLVTAALGRLMMGALMMAVDLKGDDELLTLEVRGDGPIAGLTVTANSHGQVKGFANHPNVWLPLDARGKLPVGAGIGAGTLAVVRDTPGEHPYSSTIELASGEIGDDLALYFSQSDQIPTSVGVGVLVDTDTSVRRAGGFVVQLMPGYDDALVDELEERLSGVSSVTEMLEAGMSPSDVLAHILSGWDYRELGVSPVGFHCGCDRARAARATLALGEAEIRDMVAKGEPAEVHCHFCGEEYRFEPEELAEMLEEQPGR